MKVPCLEIKKTLESSLKKEVQKIKGKKKKLQLVTILVGHSPEQESFVAIKKSVASRLGIGFTFVHIKKPPAFEEFANILKKYSHDPAVTGIIIQQPLPVQMQTDSVYNYIPLEKEIEGHKHKSPFHPPLALAVLTIVKYIFANQKISPKLWIDLKQDNKLLKKNLKNKRIVLAGRGITGGLPIGKTFSALGINYFHLNSQTPDPENFYKDADIIITATGKRIITLENTKPGVILLNVGLRKEKGQLKGDYDENEMKNQAAFYTPTPGGIGPLDVLYLYKNLLDASRLQKHR